MNYQNVPHLFRDASKRHGYDNRNDEGDNPEDCLEHKKQDMH